jgi:hypothetical protein
MHKLFSVVYVLHMQCASIPSPNIHVHYITLHYIPRNRFRGMNSDSLFSLSPYL